jgi:hypothetical protein
LLLASGFWLLAIYSTFVSSGILKQVQDDDVSDQQLETNSVRALDNQYRHPLSVHRLPSVTPHDKRSAHARFTVHGYTEGGQRRDETHKAEHIAGSQQPEASSDLAPDKTVKHPSSLFKPFQALAPFPGDPETSSG